MADISIIVGYETVKQADKAFKILDKTIKTSASQYEAAFKRVTAWQKKFANEQNKAAAATNKLRLSQQLSNKSARESADVFNKKARAEEANTAALNSFRMQIDAVYKAEQKLLRLKKMLRAEVEAGNMTMRQAAAVQMQYKKSLTTMGGGLQQTKNKMSSMGVVTQQAGYQLGDFIVQVQGGQSAFIAFSQQATQMVGFLPLMAAKLGITTAAAVGLSAVLGIAIPIVSSIAMVLLNVSKSAKEAEDGVKSLKDQMVSANEATTGFADEIERLNLGLRDVNEQALFRGVQAASDAVLEAELALGKAEKLRGDRAGAILLSKQTELATARALVVTRQEELDAHRAGRTERDAILDSQKESLRLEEALKKAAEDYKDMVEEITRSQKDQIALAAKIFVYGKGHVEVAKLRAKQEGISKGLIGDELDEYILMEMVLRNIVSATEEVADATASSAEAAERFARALKSAALAGQTLASLKFEFSAGGRSMSLYAGRSTTSDRPIEGDLPEGYGEEVSSVGGVGASAKDPLQTLQEQIALQQTLLGKTEAQQQIINALGVDYQSKYKPSVIDALETQITLTGILSDADTKRKDALEQAAKQQEAIADTIATSMGNALMSMVDGTMSVKDAFKSMASAVIKDLYRILVVEKMVQSIKGYLKPASTVASAVVPSANGNVFSGGSLQAYANGGVVGGPTTFPMAGGKTGLMGEAGPEAIMPLKRGANGKLGVQMEGGGGDTINVVQNFNFQANGDDTIKQLIAQAAPKIAQMTKSSLLDDRRRGGSTKAAFG
jgi:hypothetical protein